MAELFERPELLWILLALIPFALWDIARRWGAPRGRQLFSVALRLLMLAAIIVAVARPQLTHTDRVAQVIFVIDRSASVPDALLDRAREQVDSFRETLTADERAGLVLFDAQPSVEVYPGEQWSWPEALRDDRIDQTNLGMAIQVALGLIPHERAGRIVLLSDARPTQGDASAALASARSRGVAIHTVPIDPGFTDPAVYSIELQSPTVRPGESLAGDVVLRGGPGQLTGQLRVMLGDAVVLDESVVLEPTETLRVPFEHSPDETLEPGLATLTAELTPNEPELDMRLENNTLTAGVDVAEPPAVLIVADDTAEVSDLGTALEAESMVPTVVATGAYEAGDYELQDFDLVILANVPAIAPEDEEGHVDTISAERIDELRRYVSAGGGLVVLGGDKSYELGGYGQTDLATVLPIELEPRDPEVEPAVTMLMILDNSGSMGSWAEGGTKMDLANQGAAAAARLLRPFDQIGVMAVDDRIDWVVRPQAAEGREAIERSILGIPVGGGGIYVYTSLREAYRTMRGADTPLRHVILFTDAADSEEQVQGIIFGWGPGPNSYDLARSMRSEGITVSVIAIGTEWDQDVNFCRNLADAGGGRFYLTDRASELESLFIEETQRLVDSVLNETPFRVRARAEDHPAIDGLEFRRSPRLRGLIELEARETAQVVLAHPDDHPVLTTWQYGLGQVAALAVDAGPRWSQGWLDWDGYGVFWSQLSRWSMRRHEGDDTAIDVDFDDEGAVVTVARRSFEGLTEVEGGLRAELVDVTDPESPDARGVELSILEPGLWQAGLVTEPGRRYRVLVRDAEGEVFAEQTFVAPPSAEFRHETADAQLLATLSAATEGEYEPGPEGIGGPLSSHRRSEPVWLWFVCGALILMPADAFLRRPGRDA